MQQLSFVEFPDPIVHPTNRVWPGMPDYPMPSLSKAYDEGHRRGWTWPKNKRGWEHVPGGPFVHFGRSGLFGRPDPCQALCTHSQRVHREWLRGWHDGFKEACKGDLPKWYRG